MRIDRAGRLSLPVSIKRDMVCKASTIAETPVALSCARPVPMCALAQIRHDNGEKPSKPFRISSGYGRVCTTFSIQLKVFRQAEAELPQ
jgi:hypothetical protein